MNEKYRWSFSMSHSVASIIDGLFVMGLTSRYFTGIMTHRDKMKSTCNDALPGKVTK